MKTTSMDPRRRIAETYDEGKWTQEEGDEVFPSVGGHGQEAVAATAADRAD